MVIEISMKHIHLFRHMSGGCGTGECEDIYECECGASFKAITHDSDVHLTLPQYIPGKDMPDPMTIS